jgi:hypothetical protein
MAAAGFEPIGDEGKCEVRPWDWTNWGPPLWYGDSPGLATANSLNSCPRGCKPCAIGNG